MNRHWKTYSNTSFLYNEIIRNSYFYLHIFEYSMIYYEKLKTRFKNQWASFLLIFENKQTKF